MAYIGKGLDNGVRNQFVFAATQGQTSFSGSDSDGKTLAMTDILYTDCYQNGVKLKPTTDYTVTSTTLTLVSAASVNDVINIVSFDTFAVPDTVSASTGGTFVGQVTFTADTTFADGADIVTASAGTSNFRAGVNAGNSIQAGGNYNVTVGDEAGTSITTGVQNTILGSLAGDALTNDSDSTAVGYAALSSATVGGNTAVGSEAMQNATTGSSNVAVGVQALRANTSAVQGTAIGYGALTANTTGSNNTAVGYNSLVANTTGDTNVAIGKDSMKANTTGTNNTALGPRSLQSNTTAASNVAVGDLAGGGVTTGANNTFLGTNAGDNVTTGTDNILIGLNPSTSQVDSQRQIVMGRNVVGAGGDHLTFGDGSTDSAIQFGATSITAPSDVRYKEDIADATAGLAFVKDLRPVTFKWKKEKDLPTSHRAYVEGSESRTINDYTNHGFIAQEVKAVIDAHSEIKDGFDMWSTDEQADGGRQRIGDASLMPIMVKAVQELSAKNDDLKTKNDALEARITALESA